MIDPVIGAVLAGCFALLFAAAAIHKLRERARFAEAFRAYGIVPSALSAGAALVPLIEMAVAAGLLTRATRATAAAAAAALLVAYALAIGINVVRGRRDIACGCGGPADRRPIAAWMVWRNFALAALAAVAGVKWQARPLAGVDALTIGAGIVVAALLYLSLDELLGRSTGTVAPAGGAP